jgi:hypothetical protein
LFRFVAVALILLACAQRVRAQSFIWSPYSTSVYNEGPGLRPADTPIVFHPGFNIESGWDSNVFYLPRAQPSVGAPLLRLRAHLDVATLPPQRQDPAGTIDPKVDFRFSTQVEYREYLTSQPDIEGQRSLNLQAAADVGILPRGPFTLRLFETFVRTVDPRNEEGPHNFSRDFNRAGLQMSYERGLLTVGLGDFVELNLWENRDMKFGDMVRDEGQLFAKFRFLIDTVGIVLVRGGYITYLHNTQLEAAPLRATVGMATALTYFLTASASLGYGNSFHLHAGSPSFQSVIGSAELRFRLPTQATATVAWDRDFYDSLFADFYVDDHLFVAFEQPLIWRIIAKLQAGLRFRHYGGLVPPALVAQAGYSSTVRDDRVWDARAEINIKATDWLQVGANYQLIADQTDFYFLTTAGARIQPDYLKQSVFGRLDFSY